MVPFQKVLKYRLIPVYRKDEPYDKNNYRSISILSNLSKIYERYIPDEINAYFDDILSNLQFGVRKDYIAQHCLLYMLEKVRKIMEFFRLFLRIFLKLVTVFHVSNS